MLPSGSHTHPEARLPCRGPRRGGDVGARRSRRGRRIRRALLCQNQLCQRRRMRCTISCGAACRRGASPAAAQQAARQRRDAADGATDAAENRAPPAAAATGAGLTVFPGAEGTSHRSVYQYLWAMIGRHQSRPAHMLVPSTQHPDGQQMCHETLSFILDALDCCVYEPWMSHLSGGASTSSMLLPIAAWCRWCSGLPGSAAVSGFSCAPGFSDGRHGSAGSADVGANARAAAAAAAKAGPSAWYRVYSS